MKNNNRLMNKYIYIYILVYIVSFVLAYAAGVVFSDENNIFYAKSYLKAENTGRIDNSINVIETDSKAWSYRVGRPINLTEGNYEINLKYYVEADTPVSIKLTSEYDVDTHTYPVIELGTLTPDSTQAQFSVYIPQDAYMSILYMDYAGYGTAQLQEFEITGADGEIFINKQIVAFIIATVAAVFAVFIAFFLCKGTREGKIKAINTVVLAVIIAASSVILFRYDSFAGDDAYFHISRIWGIADNIMRGSPFNKVDFAMTGGYGYMDPVFYPNLFLYIPAVMVCIGASLSCAYRLFILLINIATVLISYYSFGKLAKNNIYGLLCAAIYCLNHYRIRDYYVRGAVGELLFIAFLPLVFYSIYEIFHNKEEKWALLVIAATCIFQSHILGTVLTAIGAGVLILAYLLYAFIIKSNVKKPLFALIKAGITTVLINIWFLVPFLYYYTKDFAMFGNYSQMYINFASTFKGILFDISGLSYEMQYARMGLTVGLLFVVYIISAVLNMLKSRKVNEHIIYLVLSVVFLILCTKYLPWQEIIKIGIFDSLLAKIQFAFRVISLVIAFMTMGIALLLKDSKSKICKIAAIIVTALLIVSGSIYHVVEQDNINAFDGEFWFGYVPPEYYMNGVREGEITGKEKFRTASEGIEIKEYSMVAAGVKITIDNSTPGDNYLEIPLFYYDGYQAYSEKTDQYLPVQFGTNGLIRVIIPSTVDEDIYVRYNSNIFFHIAEFISLAAFLIFVVYNILNHKKRLLKS